MVNSFSIVKICNFLYNKVSTYIFVTFYSGGGIKLSEKGQEVKRITES